MYHLAIGGYLPEHHQPSWQDLPASTGVPAVVSAASKPKAPSHLAEPTKRWWRAVVAYYALEPHHIRLLTLAGDAWDRANQARALLAAEGITYTDDRSGTPRAHPAIAIERDSSIRIARLIRELDLDGEPGPDPRPPRRT